MMKNLFFLTAVVALTAVFAGCNKSMDTPDPNYFDAGVTINGVTWATRNVASPGMFAAKPEDAGLFYQWNRKIGWSTTGTVVGWPTTGDSGLGWIAENDPCPSGWRVPTISEIYDLASVSSMWTTSNGINGRKIGSGSKAIFLPAPGYRGLTGSLLDVGTEGDYWSSGYNSSSQALTYRVASHGVGGTNKVVGASIRCVKK